MLHILVLTCLLYKASAAQIIGYGNTTAVYGGDAHYRCVMNNPTGVLQVTWQRLFKDESIENLATYSKRFGQQINEPEKVMFTEASLSSTSITLKNVTWEDESCYICSFNGYPDGSTRSQTCLTVQGISEVHTTYFTNNGHEDEVVFSCSATGKPAPTIEWDFTDAAATTNTTVTNSDETFTSSSNITLQIPPDRKMRVDCLLNRGMKGQRKETISFIGHGKKQETKNAGKGRPALEAAIVVIVLIILCIVVAVVMRHKRSKGYRRNADVTQEEGFAFQQTS